VPASTGGIQQADVLRLGDLEEVCLGFALDVVGHVLAKPGAGAVQQPEAAEGVFDEIADDPVRGEELSDGRNVLRRHSTLAGHDLVFALGDVELVEPADDLDLLPIFLIDISGKLPDQRVCVEQVVGQKKFCFVAYPLKEKRHRSVKRVALSEQQHPVQLGFFAAFQLQLNNLVLVQPWQIKVLGLFENLRNRLRRIRMAQYPVAVVKIAVQLHIPDGDQAVEPGVSDRLYGLPEAVLGNPFFQSLTFGRNSARKGAASDDGHVAVLGDGLNLLLSQTIEGGAVYDGLNEIPASLRGVGLEFGAVHIANLRFSSQRISIRSSLVSACSNSDRSILRNASTSACVSK
jgi:hypothetical protein